MDKEQYKVVWSDNKKIGEATATGPLAALGYADRVRIMGAEVVKIIYNGVTQSLEEFEKTLLGV